MHGVVLWFNPVARVGMIWCEDQGPLAFLAPEIALPAGEGALASGDQILFTLDVRDGVRYVRDVFEILPGAGGADPREIISGYHHRREAASHRNTVA